MRAGRVLLAGLAACVVAYVGVSLCQPVVVLHYSAQASGEVDYFYNDNNHITKDGLQPGESVRFREPLFPDEGDWIDVSLPFASRDGVEIKPPFSRVDIYIDAATKIAKVDTQQRFLARFGF